jgi:hypothetical protein
MQHMPGAMASCALALGKLEVFEVRREAKTANLPRVSRPKWGVRWGAKNAHGFRLNLVGSSSTSSPSSFRLDLGAKADLYAQVGVEFMWLVEPEGHLIEAYQVANGAWLRLGAYSGQACVRIPPFDAIELELGPLWVTKLPEGD